MQNPTFPLWYPAKNSPHKQIMRGSGKEIIILLKEKQTEQKTFRFNHCSNVSRSSFIASRLCRWAWQGDLYNYSCSMQEVHVDVPCNLVITYCNSTQRWRISIIYRSCHHEWQCNRSCYFRIILFIINRLYSRTVELPFITARTVLPIEIEIIFQNSKR